MCMESDPVYGLQFFWQDGNQLLIPEQPRRLHLFVSSGHGSAAFGHQANNATERGEEAMTGGERRHKTEPDIH